MLGFITGAFYFIFYPIFGQLANIISNPLSDDSFWWLAVIGLAVVALIV